MLALRCPEVLPENDFLAGTTLFAMPPRSPRWTWERGARCGVPDGYADPIELKTVPEPARSMMANSSLLVRLGKSPSTNSKDTPDKQCPADRLRPSYSECGRYETDLGPTRLLELALLSASVWHEPSWRKEHAWFPREFSQDPRQDCEKNLIHLYCSQPGFQLCVEKLRAAPWLHQTAPTTHRGGFGRGRRGEPSAPLPSYESTKFRIKTMIVFLCICTSKAGPKTPLHAVCR